MRSISLAPATFYAGEIIVSHNWRESDSKESRMIRTDVALDTTVVVSDSGFSWGDTSMELSIEYKERWEQTLTAWLIAWPLLTVCRFDGVFSVALQSVQHKSGRLSLKLAVIGKV